MLTVFYCCLCPLGKHVYELSAAKRLHDHHGDPFGSCSMKSVPTRLCDIFELLPHGDVGQVVHEIIIDPVGAEP